MSLFQRHKRTWRRRNFFVKKEFQTRFILKFLSVVMFGSAMSGYIMYLLINRNVEDVFYSSHIKLNSTGQLILPTLLKVNFGVLSLVLLAVAVITLFISHRVAGPLYRLGKSTEKIAEGDFTGNFQLRTNDELKSLAKSFEDMNNNLKTVFTELREHAETVNKASEDLFSHYELANKSRLGMVDKGLVAEKLGEMYNSTEAFGKRLSIFQIEKKKGTN